MINLLNKFREVIDWIDCSRVNGNGSKEMGRIGLLCHGSNLHRFGIGSNGLGSTLKNAKFKRDNILISTQFDLSYSTKRVDLILFDLFHSFHFMQSIVHLPLDSGSGQSSHSALWERNALWERTKFSLMLCLNQSRMCGKGVGLGLFPSEVEKWPFLTIFGLILTMFLTSQPYDFDAIAHKGL